MKPGNFETIDDYINNNKPHTLYHYTTQKGMLGIIRSGEIWATSARYLNDQKEYLHGFDIFKKVLLERIEQSSNGETKNTLEEMLGEINSIGRALNFNSELGSYVYISSFSEEGDSLSQWRAYG